MVFPSTDPATQNLAIFLARADGSDKREIELPYSSTIGLYSPVWSPDGSQIAYLAYDLASDQRSPSQIAIIDVSCLLRQATCSVQPRLAGVGPVRMWSSIDWSPDGSRIVYASKCPDVPDEYNTCIFTSRVDGMSYPVVLTPSSLSCDNPVWSPDGARILAECHDPSYYQPDGTYEVDANGANFHLLIKDGFKAQWSPDGKYIVLGLPDRDHSVGLMADAATDMELLYRADPDGKNLQPLKNHAMETVNWFVWYPPKLGSP